MVNNVMITNGDTTVLEASEGIELASVGFYLCNSSTSDEIVTIHLVGDGSGVTSNSTTIVKDLTVKAGDTFQFGYEKFLLSEFDKLIVTGRDGMKVSATVTFMDVTT